MGLKKELEGLEEIHDISEVLYKETKSEGKRRECIFMMTNLFELKLAVRRISSMLAILLGLIIYKFLSGLF